MVPFSFSVGQRPWNAEATSGSAESAIQMLRSLQSQSSFLAYWSGGVPATEELFSAATDGLNDGAYIARPRSLHLPLGHSLRQSGAWQGHAESIDENA